MGSPTIFQGSFVKCLKGLLNLNNTAYVLQGTADPTSVAQNAPQGSIYLRTGASGGTIYTKQDSGSSTNWTALIASSVGNSGVILSVGNGHGSTNTKIARWTNNSTSGTDLTYADSATNGGSITVNTTGLYHISYVVRYTSGPDIAGISINTTEPTTDINAVSDGSRVWASINASSTDTADGSFPIWLTASDVIRLHDRGVNFENTDTSEQHMRVFRIG